MKVRPAELRIARRTVFVAIGVLALAGTLAATTVVPISDRELFRRADVVVHGIVGSSETVEARDGWPETVTFVRPLRVWKGSVAGDLVLRQAGGVLPDGRFFKMWGRPEYKVGDEVIVFALALPEGDFQTAEMLLGKFTVARDESGRFFAVPDLSIGDHPGVTVRRAPGAPDRIDPSEEGEPLSLVSPERMSSALSAESDERRGSSRRSSTFSTPEPSPRAWPEPLPSESFHPSSTPRPARDWCRTGATSTTASGATTTAPPRPGPWMARPT